MSGPRRHGSSPLDQPPLERRLHRRNAVPGGGLGGGRRGPLRRAHARV